MSDRLFTRSTGVAASSDFAPEKISYDDMVLEAINPKEIDADIDIGVAKRHELTSFVFGRFAQRTVTDSYGRKKKEHARGDKTCLERNGAALDFESIKVNGEVKWELTPEKKEEILSAFGALGIKGFAYSSISSTEAHPRFRLVIPFEGAWNKDRYEVVARRLAKKIGGLEYLDLSSVKPQQPQMLPVKVNGGDYWYREFDGTLLDPADIYDEIASEMKNPDHPESFDRREGEKVARPKNPYSGKSKPGIFAAICETYTPEEIIEEYLSDAYIKTNEGEYHYHRSEDWNSAGAVISDDGQMVFCMNGEKNPACQFTGRTPAVVNSFDLLRYEMFPPEDASQEAEKESRKQAIEFFKNKSSRKREIKNRVKEYEKSEMFKAREDQIVGSGSESEKEALANLFERLEKNEKTGAVKSTGTNIRTIISEDPRLAGKVYYNEFDQYITMGEPMPWVDPEKRKTPCVWRDSDDAELRLFLERVYGIRSAAATEDALVSVAHEHSRHPVKEFILKAEWDGVPRLDTVFIDYFKTDDNIYYREAARMFFAGAVKRIFEPGCKHDICIVIHGAQGIGKSTFLSRIAGEEFHKDDKLQLSRGNAKDAMEQIQDSFIYEIAELQGYENSLDDVKGFISKRFDSYRAPYAKRKVTSPRHTVFAATSNNAAFLRDPTGERRFWPIQSRAAYDDPENYPEKTIFENWMDYDDEHTLTDDMIAQLWAEAYTIYKNGEAEKIDLSRDAKIILEEIQAAYKFEDGEKQLILNYLTAPIPDNYMDVTKAEKQNWWRAIEEGVGVTGTPRLREYTSTVEIQAILLDRKTDNRVSRKISKILSNTIGIERLATASVNFGPGIGYQHPFRLTKKFFEHYGKDRPEIMELLSQEEDDPFVIDDWDDDDFTLLD